MGLAENQGFKQTEAGLIPEDWSLVPFNTVFSFCSTSNYSKAQMSEDDEFGCIHYGLIHEIKNTKYDVTHGIKYYVSSEQAKYELVRDGDVIMVDASEDLEGINKSVEIFGVGNNKYISGLHTYLLRDKDLKLANNFRGILLNSQRVKNQMLRLAVGMKVYGVSKTQLVNVLLPLPTLTEQKSIATALTDVDELISGLEKLISKKKDIKLGTMQQLMTLNDDWEIFKIEEISIVGRGRVISHKEINSSKNKTYPVYSSQTANNGVMGFIDTYDFDGEYVTGKTDGENAGTVFHRNGKFNCTNVCGTIS